MAQSQTTALHVSPREAAGSREARRLRRTGGIPGVVYGGGEDPVSFAVEERTLRHALANAGAVMDLTIKGAGSTPVVVKELVRHPVTNATVHIDLLRVRLDVKIQATVFLELTGVDDAPGIKDGGVLEQQLRELNIEALPNDIPESLTHDVSEMQIGDTLTVEALTVPGSLTLLDESDIVVATLSPPRLQVEADDEIESETEVVGEGAEAAGDDAGSDDAGSDAE
jgi:large subunit ribosomal protein L25